jgi:hypothetical protein
VGSLIVTYRNMSGNTPGTAGGDQRRSDADAAVSYLRSRKAASPDLHRKTLRLQSFIGCHGD